MIWFACKQCGKKHSRPDSQAGSMVFCDCGRGNMVPWSSTTEPASFPEVEPLRVPAARPVPERIPRAVPVPQREPVPQGRRPEPVPLPAREPPPPAELPLPSRRPDRLPRRVRPNLCFNHDEDASQENCSACKLPFCGRCLVTIQGQVLCGPCKNFRIGGMGRTTRVLPMAVLALVVALVSGPVVLVLTLLGVGIYLSEGSQDGLGVAIALCVLALTLPGTGLVLTRMAQRRFEARPRYGGRGLASSAACASAVGILWAVVVAAVLITKAVQG